MNNEQIKDIVLALFEFIKRATSKGATAAEVEALPAVASALLDYFSSGILDKAS